MARAAPLIVNGAFCKGGTEALDRHTERMERLEDLPKASSNKEAAEALDSLERVIDDLEKDLQEAECLTR